MKLINKVLKYTNTQIHKYTNSQIHKYWNKDKNTQSGTYEGDQDGGLFLPSASIWQRNNVSMFYNTNIDLLQRRS